MKLSNFFSLPSLVGGQNKTPDLSSPTRSAKGKHPKAPPIATYAWPLPLEIDSAVLELPTASGHPPKFLVASWAGETSRGVIAESVVLPLPLTVSGGAAMEGGKGRSSPTPPSLGAIAEAERTRSLLASLSPSPSFSPRPTPVPSFPARFLRRSRRHHHRHAAKSSTGDVLDEIRHVLSQRQYASYVLLRVDSRRALAPVASLAGGMEPGADAEEDWWMTADGAASVRSKAWCDDDRHCEEKWVGAHDVPAGLRSRISSVSSLSS